MFDNGQFFSWYVSNSNEIFLNCSFNQGQQYSRIRLFEYIDYSDVTFFKFNIYASTTLANWSVIIQADGQCTDYYVNIHLYTKTKIYFFMKK